MGHNKITRGISKEFGEAFKKCELYELYKKHEDELFIGIRNNYLNLYYNCDSIAKVEYKGNRKKIVCEIDKYYLDGNHNISTSKEKRLKTVPHQINEQYEVIKKYSNKKSSDEKKAQSKLILLNNNNKNSKWFCIDIEYVKQFHNKKEKEEADFNGRFDIIAISKNNPHRIALIELKYGGGAIGGKSGIYKHIEDFKKFNEKKYFEHHLKQEIIEIIESQIELGISVPFDLPLEKNILTPDFYIITLNNTPNENGNTPKQTMAGYLFKNKQWNCQKLSTKVCVETSFGNVTKKDNIIHTTFLFSIADLNKIEITDIIDGIYDEKIVPK